ncbi:sulfite exporter TauE/SafE family protein [Candidatus Uhrbacteria bacterium]|nr:sulfite exporter TauE/SafE family protein [Candidatus Uhrbacteria bacterium]
MEQLDPLFVVYAFVAGILTFFAPCTLPLVPAYLGFISGVSPTDFADPAKARIARKRVFLHCLLFVVGFSAVFIFFGTLIGLGGIALTKYRPVLQQAGGVLVIFFALYLLGVLRLPFLRFLDSEKHFPLTRILKPGKPWNSFLFGAAFASGWTPCIGPILGSILTAAATSTQVWQGAGLLTIYSLGLGVPFLLVAVGIGSTNTYLVKTQRFLPWVSVIGGIFLLVLGILIVTNNMNIWTGFFYRNLNILHYERLLDYL